MQKRATLQMSGKDIKGLKRGELLEMKRDLKRLLQAVEKLTKANPELGDNAKRGSPAGGATEPGSNAGTQLDEDLQARYRFEDPTVRDVAYGVTKR